MKLIKFSIALFLISVFVEISLAEEIYIIKEEYIATCKRNVSSFDSHNSWINV